MIRVLGRAARIGDAAAPLLKWKKYECAKMDRALPSRFSGAWRTDPPGLVEELCSKPFHLLVTTRFPAYGL
jgi:hypothetical protein